MRSQLACAILNYISDQRGLAESLASKKLSENKDLGKLQDQLGNQLGAIFGKGGVGEELGSTLGKTL